MDKIETFAGYCFGLSIVGLMASLAVKYVAFFFEDRFPYVRKIKDCMAGGYFTKLNISLFLLSIFLITLRVILRCIVDDIPLGTRIIIGLSCSFGMVMSFLCLQVQWEFELLQMKDYLRSLRSRG